MAEGYIEIICAICGKPILKDDKSEKNKNKKLIHDYCKYKKEK